MCRIGDASRPADCRAPVSVQLLCDVCDSAAHTYCVGRGRQVPEGDWFCHTCAEADDALTSGSDASVGEEELGESSDSEGDAEEARPRSHQPGGAMTDEDSDTEFLLDIQFDTHPTGAILTRRARRLGSSNSAGAQGPQGGAEGPGRRRRAVRRRGNGRQGQERLSSVPSLDRGGAVGASERGGRREGQVGNSEAASGRWGRGHGSARTLQVGCSLLGLLWCSVRFSVSDSLVPQVLVQPHHRK